MGTADAFGTRALERLVGNLANPCRTAVESFTYVTAAEAEFGCDDGLIAHWFERLTNDTLIDERAIGFRGIEKGYAFVESSADQLDDYSITNASRTLLTEHKRQTTKSKALRRAANHWQR